MHHCATNFRWLFIAVQMMTVSQWSAINNLRRRRWRRAGCCGCGPTADNILLMTAMCHISQTSADVGRMLLLYGIFSNVNTTTTTYNPCDRSSAFDCASLEEQWVCAVLMAANEFYLHIMAADQAMGRGGGTCPVPSRLIEVGPRQPKKLQC